MCVDVEVNEEKSRVRRNSWAARGVSGLPFSDQGDSVVGVGWVGGMLENAAVGVKRGTGPLGKQKSGKNGEKIRGKKNEKKKTSLSPVEPKIYRVEIKIKPQNANWEAYRGNDEEIHIHG